jgi:hypothetical protein
MLYSYQDQIIKYISHIEWGQLPDYLIVITTSIIAFIVYRADNKRVKESQIFQRELNKPILGFLNKTGSSYYTIRNYGKGAALNIFIAIKKSKESKEWEDYVNCYSLEAGNELDLTWIKPVHAFIVKYEDSFGVKYITTCKDDLISVSLLSNNNEHNNFVNYIDENYNNTQLIQRLWQVKKNYKQA